MSTQPLFIFAFNLGGDTPEEANLVYEKEIESISEVSEDQWITLPILGYGSPFIGTESAKNLWITFHYDNRVPIAGDTQLSDADPNGGWMSDDSEWTQYLTGKVFLIGAQFAPFIPTENLIWSEDFEGGEMPEGWTIDQTLSQNWHVGTGDYKSEIGAHSGQYNALRTHSHKGHVQKLITPLLDLSDYYDLTLHFWFINRKWYDEADTLVIYYRNTPDGEWNVLGTTTSSHEHWSLGYSILYNLSSTYQIAFEMYDGFGYGIGLDDIYITGKRIPEPTDPEGETLTVYEGEAKSDHVPFYGLYAEAYTRAQYLIPAEGLTALQGKRINGLRWYSNRSSYPDYGDARIDLYLKEVDSTALRDFVEKAEEDIVYHGEIIFSKVDGRFVGTIKFDKEFVYQGGALVVGCDNVEIGKWTSIYWYGQVADDASVYGRSSDALSVITATQANFIPKTTFYYEDETGIEEIYEGAMYDVRSRKILHDGHLFILRNGKLFNATGVNVK